MGAVRATALGACLSLALVLWPQAAAAASPLKIREVYPGNGVAPATEYVELQMTASGQNDVDGQMLRFYDASGSETSSFLLPGDVANGEAQRTILFSNLGAGTRTPDFLVPEADRMSPAGGAVCFTGSSSDDCLTWGSIPIFAPFSGFPDPQSSNAAVGGIGDGGVLRRTIARGCPTYLDGPDDTDSSLADFSESQPDAHNNSVVPPEQPCPPETLLTSFPANPTNQAFASFSYAESPAEQGASFQCALDWDGTLDAGDLSPCPGGTLAIPGPLAEGPHSFAVRASGAGGADPTPKTYSWVVDTLAPETAISSFPPEPSNGFAASFAYLSSEADSSFRCQLDQGAVQLCAASGKTYFGLSDGSHSFRVWATDNAGNGDETAAEHSFEVQNVLRDQTPPDTTVLSGPPSRSTAAGAAFTYASSEPGSSFECRLGGRPFGPCPVTGVAYANLANASYGFEVRARDAAGNVDSVPASFAWTVAAAGPSTRFEKAPPGRISSKSGRPVRVAFRFVADARASFRCRLDRKGRFRPCHSPKRLRAGLGRHIFEVYAIDRLGNVEKSPARRIFRVQRAGKGGLLP